MTVRTRMAPSPTGNLHLGTAYATLWPYLSARHNKGQFIIRIEDTDQERSTAEFAQGILSGLTWLGLDWDEGPFYQMQRLKLYQQAVDRLLKEGKAYPCFCSKEELEREKQAQVKSALPQVYSGKCRQLTAREIEEKKAQGLGYIIRYKLPQERGPIEVNDLLHGKVLFDPKLLGDMIIMRQNGVALYNFAVVVDDIDMKITHVIRGDDHLSNTPKQVLFFEALGTTPPVFAHYPMVLNQDRVGKLSKRTGSTALNDYKTDGFLPEVLLNYLASIGWTHPKEKEVYTKEELIELFDISQMNNSAAAWNSEKLEWLNGEYIRAMSDDKLKDRVKDYLDNVLGSGSPDDEKLTKVIPLIKERIKKLSDFIPLTDFLWEKPEYDLETFQKVLKDQSETTEVLQSVSFKLEQLTRPWRAEDFEAAFKNLAQKGGISNTEMFQLIRVAVSGQLVTPPLFESIKILGEEEAEKRVKEALSFLSS